jgi:transposase InsO family protein
MKRYAAPFFHLEARTGVSGDYLEIWHNRRRRHSRLGMLTPIEFENRTPTIVA